MKKPLNIKTQSWRKDNPSRGGEIPSGKEIGLINLKIK